MVTIGRLGLTVVRCRCFQVQDNRICRFEVQKIEMKNMREGHMSGASCSTGGGGGLVDRTLAVLSVLVLVAFLPFVTPSFAQSDSLTPRFERANQAYLDGRYEEATETYRQILDAGYGSPSLYHNLGNAYVRLDSTGAAVWAYQKALQFDPGDRRVQHNLEFVRQREGLQVGGLPPRGVVALASGWPTTLLFVLGLLLLTSVAVTGVFRAKDEQIFHWRDPLVWGAFILGGLLVVAALGASYLKTYDLRAVVTGDQAAIRPTGNEKVAPDTTIRPGSMVEVRSQDSSWIRVRLGDGTVGWVRSRNIREL